MHSPHSVCHCAVRTTAPSLQTLRAFLRELGPLRWIALFTAVVPTVLLMVLLSHVAMVAVAWPVGWLGAGLAVVAIAVTTGAVLLPASIVGLTAGYVFGAALGGSLAAVGIACGGVFGQRCVWPLLGRGLYAFMRARPRVHGVQRVCAGGFGQQVVGVLLLRSAGKFPFAVISLLLSAASVPTRSVLVGSLVAALPMVWLTSGIGAAWRVWREQHLWPSGLAIANLALAFAAAATALLLARRRLKLAASG